ncbi:MAG: DUF559 domain-containing protein [Anaeromyxobacteraceae bacterium]
MGPSTGTTPASGMTPSAYATLAAAGFKVLRFTNQEALAATEFVALAILDEVERLTAIRPKPTSGSSRRRDRLAPSP